MRRVTVFLSVIAFAALAASSAQATTFYDWEYIDTSEGPVNFTNPYATTEGALWIKSGSSITLMAQDVNVQLLVNVAYRGLDTAHWLSVERSAGRYSDHQYVALERLGSNVRHSQRGRRRHWLWTWRHLRL